MCAKPPTSTSGLYATYGSASMRKLPELSPAQWLEHELTTATQFCTAHQPPISTSCRESSTHWHGWCQEPGSAITSHRFWLICIGSQSPPVSNSRSLFRHSRHWQQINLNTLLICSIFRLHPDLSVPVPGCTFTLTLLELFLLAVPSVTLRLHYGTLFLFIWLFIVAAYHNFIIVLFFVCDWAR